MTSRITNNSSIMTLIPFLFDLTLMDRTPGALSCSPCR
jgi:hypothetical protein